jgi:hypothetical protein
LQVEETTNIPAGALAENYTEGGDVTLAHGEVVDMLLVQGEVATEDGRVVTLYHVTSTI